MYNSEIVKELIPKANDYIEKNMRIHYEPFFITAEKYIAENKIIIGGDNGIHTLLGHKRNKDSFKYELYTDEPFKHAKELANALYATKLSKDNPINKKYINTQTKLKYREFSVSINTRELFMIYSLSDYEGIKLRDLVDPVEAKGLFSGISVLCMNREVQLMELYRKLYNPLLADDWISLLIIENELFGEKKDGGRRMPKQKINKNAPDIPREYYQRQKWKQNIEKQILEKFVANAKYTNLLIGDYAMAMSENVKVSEPRLQFISQFDIKAIISIISKILKQFLRNSYVVHSEHKLNIPTDFRIRKYILYIKDNRGNQIAIADVYNSLQYDVIPYDVIDGMNVNITDIENKLNTKMYLNGRYKVGSSFVLMRYRMLDLWSLGIIYNKNKLRNKSNDKTNQQIENIVNEVNEYRKDTMLIIGQTPDKIFPPPDNYLGNYIDEAIAKKQMIKDIGEQYPKIYPIFS